MIKQFLIWTVGLKYVKEAIVSSFLCLKLITVIYALVTGGIKKSILYIILFIIYSIIALLCFKGDKVGKAATYIMIISILLTSMGCIVVVLVAPIEQMVFKVFSLFLGVYFALCGIILILEERTEREIEVR